MSDLEKRKAIALEQLNYEKHLGEDCIRINGYEVVSSDNFKTIIELLSPSPQVPDNEAEDAAMDAIRRIDKHTETYSGSYDDFYIVMKVIKAAKQPRQEWIPIDKFPHNDSCVDLLLNGNARVPDCYFDCYTKEWLMAGTYVPVLRRDDPMNTITHGMKHLPLPEPPKEKP